MPDDAKPKKVMPKGGPKGGTRYPRHKLDLVIGWARKLVSKTHVEPQSVDVIFAGVVGAKSGTGNVRVSSLKQYGFLDGDPKGYSASSLARKVVAAPDEELAALKQEAFLLPMVFKKIFITFQGDEVTRAKLRQRAAELKVHPEELDTCVENYVAGLLSAELGTEGGDKVVHRSNSLTTNDQVEASALDVSHDEVDMSEDVAQDEGEVENLANGSTPRAIFNVNVNLDSSLDTDKLERQLALLKRYGAI